MILCVNSGRSNQLHTLRAPAQNEKHLGDVSCHKQGLRSTEHLNRSNLSRAAGGALVLNLKKFNSVRFDALVISSP